MRAALLGIVVCPLCCVNAASSINNPMNNSHSLPFSLKPTQTHIYSHFGVVFVLPLPPFPKQFNSFTYNLCLV